MVGHLAGRDKPYRSDRRIKGLKEGGRSQTIRHMVGQGLKKPTGRERGRDTLDLPYGTSISDQNDRGFAAIPGAERHLIPAVATLEGGGSRPGSARGMK